MKKTYSEIIEVLKSNFKSIHYFLDEYRDEYDDYDDDLGVPWAFPLEDFKKG